MSTNDDLRDILENQVTGRGTVTLGQPVSTDQQAVWRRLVEAETAERSGRNVVTRSAGG